jgi:predicted esterase
MSTENNGLLKLLSKIFLFFFSCFLTIQNCVAATECLSDYEPANITQLAPNLFGISPPYASFDPCNKSVVLNIVKNSTKLVIVMHGGAGGADSQAKLASALNKEGISTLFFDAFKMNKLYKDARWWAWNNTTGPKQRMLYHSNLAAVKWLRKNTETAQMDIHLYGVSSGATAALNISSNEDLPYLKSVLIEGAAPMGIGLPDRLLKPVFFIFGAQDNYGGMTEDEFIWKRVVPCSFNVPILETPYGNAAECNSRVNSGNTINTLDSYIKQQKNKGENLTVKYYDEAGHDIFDGRIRKFRMNTPSGSLYATLGAAGGVTDKLLIDILAFIKNQ